MSALLALIGRKALGYLALVGGILAGLLALWFKAKRSGEKEVIAEAAQQEIKDVKKASEVERDVATAKPDDVRDRLSKYRRD